MLVVYFSSFSPEFQWTFSFYCLIFLRRVYLFIVDDGAIDTFKRGAQNGAGLRDLVVQIV